MRHARRPLPVLTLSVLMTGSLTALLPSAPAVAADAEGFSVVRPTPAGDRFETSASIARTAFPDGVPEAFVVNGDNPVDALAAASAAGPDVPILYTHRDTVPDSVLEALDDLNVEDVYVVGGRAVISDAVARALGSGRSIERIEGADRYETAAELAVIATADRDGLSNTVLLVRGDQLADALSAAPFAARMGIPMLLTARDHLPQATAEALDYLQPEQTFPAPVITVIGGSAALPDAIVQQAQQMPDGGTRSIYRMGGVDRYATSIDVANKTRQQIVTTIGIANGERLVDALPGAVLLAQEGANVLLTEPASLGTAARTYLSNWSSYLETAYVLGGSGSIPDSVVTELRQVAGAPAVSVAFGTRDETHLTLALPQRADYAYRMAIAPAQSTGDGAGYLPAPAAAPLGARTATLAAGGNYTFDGLRPGTGYDIWVSRSVGGLPITTVTAQQTTWFAPPSIRSVRADAQGVHVLVEDLRPGAVDGILIATASTGGDGAYQVPATFSQPIESAIPNTVLNAWMVDGQGRPLTEYTWTGAKPDVGYEVWIRTSLQRDISTISRLSYWNSATSSSQSTHDPLPTAPSVTMPR